MPKIHPKPWGDHAARLALMGLHVVPVAPRTKRPMFAGWVQCATRDRAQIRRWATEYPNANIGAVLLGEHLVVDVDDETAFAGWMDDQGYLLPRTMEVSTGRGRHLYYRLPGVLSGGNNTRVPGADLKIRGLVVAPGSLHPSGVHYRLTSPRAMCEAPGWLIELVTATPTPTGRHPGAGDPKAWPVDRQMRVASTVWAASKGNRNASAFWAFCRAYESGLAGAELRGFLGQIWRAALAVGLDEDEIATCEASAARTQVVTS
ncbi:MAG TPA: bifunctional DNA primase/polymerase [Candidatus Dietzia intestinigallinarum]|nr:bifunctional DNA primase/polymerase [Candidatus Dietzia intestinipullorum]HJC58944.1 bifunctional DNA primase/polymerase [Candidatus Dietzia intestinigallinarum]